jgi:hypothetical protein
MKRMLMCVAATLLTFTVATPTHALTTPALPAGDAFWTVSSNSSRVVKINPLTGQTLKSLRIMKHRERIIGAAWDPYRQLFVFIDGWDSQAETVQKQGAVTYSVKTKKWKRYPINFGVNNEFDVRDVAITANGIYWFAVSPWDGEPQLNRAMGFPNFADRKKLPRRFDMSSTWDIGLVDSGIGILNSLAFPQDSSLLVGLDYDYALTTFNDSGATLDSDATYNGATSEYAEASHFDFASDDSFWVYGQYGVELSWGIYGAPEENQFVRNPSCVQSCSDIFFIQRGR